MRDWAASSSPQPTRLACATWPAGLRDSGTDMSDLQPAADDIVVSQVKRGYLVGKFESVSLHRLYATDATALQVAHLEAWYSQVDVWYADDDTAWRVMRFRPTDEVPDAAGVSS
jgi:hypothetical protein